MTTIKRLGKLARLLGVVGISLGSFLIAACEGTSKPDGDADATDAADQESDTLNDPTIDRPETDLWDVVMCE
jgi:hypothetical protein